jgi:FkbM family methyltransferase
MIWRNVNQNDRLSYKIVFILFIVGMFTISNLKKALQKPKIVVSYLWSEIAYFFGILIPASQFWEDLILNYLIRKKKWFYVDIGANDPCWGNNTYYFYNKWWNGITIEPNRKLFKKIKRYRPKGINLNIAAWSWKSLTYYEIDSHGMSTCDKKVADFYKSKWHIVTNTYNTPVKPLSKIFDMYLQWKTIDILSIDVEWMDMEVLKSNDRSKYKPQYIILETMIYKWDDEPWVKDAEQYTSYLQKYWYLPIADTYVNTIYQLQE